MYLYKRGLLPNSFNDMFLLNCDVHSQNTRSKNSVRLPYCRTNVRKFSHRFQGPRIFNSLSSEIQNASGTALFNSKFVFFSWYKNTLIISSPNSCVQVFASFSSFLFLTFSFSFLHSHVQPFLFLSYVMIILYVPNKLCVLRVRLPMSVL